MDGHTLKFLKMVDEFSQAYLAIRVGRRCRAVDVIDTIEEPLKLYPPPTHLRMNNGPEFIANALQEWCTGCGSGSSSSRRSQPEAIHLSICLGAGSKAVGRAAPNRVQSLQTAFDSHKNWSSKRGHINPRSRQTISRKTSCLYKIQSCQCLTTILASQLIALT